MGDYTFIGGVKYCTSTISSHETIMIDNKKMNEVVLTNGTIIVYPNQSKNNNSEVRLSGPYAVPSTTFERIYGATVVTSQPGAHKFCGCANTYVDTSRNNQPDLITFTDDSHFVSKNNTAKRDNNDKLYDFGKW